MSNKWRLQRLCQTRWTEKYSAVLAVSELYDPIRQVSYWSSVTYVRSQQNRVAKQPFCTLFTTSSKFCVALCILEHGMAHTSILSQLLRKVDINLRTAVIV